MQSSLCLIVPVYNEQYLIEDSLRRLTTLDPRLCLIESRSLLLMTALSIGPRNQ
jgi:hypothetical protein